MAKLNIKQFYYHIDENNTLFIFNSVGNSVAHVSEVTYDFETIKMIVEDVLYNMGMIKETEVIDLTRM